MSIRCRMCKVRPAKIHYTEIVNNKMVTVDLCLECASEKGIDVHANPVYGLGDLVAELIDTTVADDNEKIGKVSCPSCGYDYSDFKNVGRFGCTECYHAFDAQLYPLLRHVHGSTQHAGKNPGRLGGRTVHRQRIVRLKEELAAAVKSEKYEKAAEIRDEIKRLEKDTGETPSC